jgi:hypothetical protein
VAKNFTHNAWGCRRLATELNNEGSNQVEEVALKLNGHPRWQLLFQQRLSIVALLLNRRWCSSCAGIFGVLALARTG